MDSCGEQDNNADRSALAECRPFIVFVSAATRPLSHSHPLAGGPGVPTRRVPRQQGRYIAAAGRCPCALLNKGHKGRPVEASATVLTGTVRKKSDQRWTIGVWAVAPPSP